MKKKKTTKKWKSHPTFCKTRDLSSTHFILSPSPFFPHTHFHPFSSISSYEALPNILQFFRTRKTFFEFYRNFTFDRHVDYVHTQVNLDIETRKTLYLRLQHFNRIVPADDSGPFCSLNLFRLMLLKVPVKLFVI